VKGIFTSGSASPRLAERRHLIRRFSFIPRTVSFSRETCDAIKSFFLLKMEKQGRNMLNGSAKKK
jgi:hypothetical protein